MPLILREVTEHEFSQVCNEIYQCMARYGRKNNFDQYIDYEVFEECWDRSQVLIRVMNLDVLNARIVAKLRRILKRRPDWEIMVRIDLPEDPPDWREMGLRIHADEVVDGLHRDCLPTRFRSLAFIEARSAVGPNLM